MVNYLLELAKGIDKISMAFVYAKSKLDPKVSRSIDISIDERSAVELKNKFEDLGWEINKIFDWYNEAKNPIGLGYECPVCKSEWFSPDKEAHKADCWIHSLKLAAFVEKEANEKVR